jgi:TonB family protein
MKNRQNFPYRYCLAGLIALIALDGARGYGSDEAPSFDPRDPAAVKAEKVRILQTYKDDRPRLAEEINRLAHTVARAYGQEELLVERERLLRKYRPESQTEYLGLYGQPGRIIDRRAWNCRFEPAGRQIKATLRLDSTRYQDAKPQNMVIQLLPKSVTEKEEYTMAGGTENAKSLVFRLEPDGAYTTLFALPLEENGEYILYVAADIEKGFSTASTFAVKPAALAVDYYDEAKVEVVPRPIFVPQPSVPGPEEKSGTGTILVAFIVETNGTVSGCELIAGINLKNGGKSDLGEIALQYVKQWRYDPAQLHGKAVRCRIQAPVVFAAAK